MENTRIELNVTTEQSIRHLYPVSLSKEDMQFIVDWFLMVGIGFTRHALKTNPQMSIGDLMHLTFHKNDS